MSPPRTKCWLRVGRADEHLARMGDGSVQCVVTSPPYFGLRDYGVDGQIGLEKTPAEFVEALRKIFADVWRVLADDGVLFLNLGDSYNAYNGNRGVMKSGIQKSRIDIRPALPTGAGLSAPDAKNKTLLGIPWRTAFALQDDGWILRNDIIWYKPNAMPQSVTDRFSSKHEHLFMFSKQARYRFHLDAVREPYAPETKARYAYGFKADTNPASKTNHLKDGGTYSENPLGKNPGDVWAINVRPFRGAHFATFPPDLAKRCILAGTEEGEKVLDPFAGAGTTLLVARSLGRPSIGIELNPDYAALARERILKADEGNTR